MSLIIRDKIITLLADYGIEVKKDQYFNGVNDSYPDLGFFEINDRQGIIITYKHKTYATSPKFNELQEIINLNQINQTGLI